MGVAAPRRVFEAEVCRGESYEAEKCEAKHLDGCWDFLSKVVAGGGGTLVVQLVKREERRRNEWEEMVRTTKTRGEPSYTDPLFIRHFHPCTSPDAHEVLVLEFVPVLQFCHYSNAVIVICSP